jgi:tRNA threonylcarbamoyladenosine biosynthesis protein TsaE
VRLSIPTSAEMETLGFTLAQVAKPGDVLVLTGELGAGKTTFARGFGKALNLGTPVSSPTFVVARTHQSQTPGAPPLVHIDAYRLGNAGELDDLDIDVEVSIVLAEWAAPFAHVLAEDWLELQLERPTGGGIAEGDGEEPRTVRFVVHGEPDRYQRFLDAAGVV